MAIVRKVLFAPSAEELVALGAMRPRRLLLPSGESRITGIAVIDTTQGLLPVSSGYRDVEFKFEVFFVTLRSDCPAARLDLTEVVVLPAGCSVNCLFRAEWLIDDATDSWETVGRRQGWNKGRLSAIPASARAVGLCMVGLAFLGPSRELLSIISVDDDASPLNIKVVRNPEKLAWLESQCERVRPMEFGKWRAGISDWDVVECGQGLTQ